MGTAREAPVRLAMPLRRLDLLGIERALADWRSGHPRPLVDLSRLEHFDAYGLLMLVLEGSRCAESGGALRLLLPEDPQVRAGLERSGVLPLLDDRTWANAPLRGDGDVPLVAVVRTEAEEAVTDLVDKLSALLRARFPFGERSTHLLSLAMLELMQNVPQHANPKGAPFDPCGLCALQELEDHVHLVVADKGIGLLGSLRRNARYRRLDHASALEAVLVDGASRFERPGRGGALRRIRQLVLRDDGEFCVRTGRGAFYQREVEWTVGRVALYPGVQISVRLPRRLFQNSSRR